MSNLIKKSWTDSTLPGNPSTLAMAQNKREKISTDPTTQIQTSNCKGYTNAKYLGSRPGWGAINTKLSISNDMVPS